MKIGDFYVDNTAFGVIALAVSIASAWFTYRTNKGMLRATERTAIENKRMADANEAMVEETRRTSEANQRMAQSNEEMVEVTRRTQTASERAAQVAEGEAQRQAQERTEANKARFVFRDGVRRGDGYEAHLVNRGPRHAENAHATVHWGDKEIGHGEQKERVNPDDDVQIAFSVSRMIDASPEDRIVTVRFTYTDGNGPHEKEWQIRYLASNDITNWRSEVISEPEF
jgi:hypothetical protein